MICSSGLSLGFPLRLAIVGSPKPAHKLSLKRRPFPLVIWGGGGGCLVGGGLRQGGGRGAVAAGKGASDRRPRPTHRRCPMARVTQADVIKFKAFLDMVLKQDPTGEFEIWDYDPFLERKNNSEDVFDDIDDDDENPPKWVRKGEEQFFPTAKVIDELLKLAGNVKEMANGRFYATGQRR